MPINNFGQKHPNIDDQQKIDDGLALIEAVLLQLSTNLSDEERQRFGSINEQNKLFANKIMDYALVSPNLRYSKNDERPKNYPRLRQLPRQPN